MQHDIKKTNFTIYGVEKGDIRQDTATNPADFTHEFQGRIIGGLIEHRALPIHGMYMLFNDAGKLMCKRNENSKEIIKKYPDALRFWVNGALFGPIIIADIKFMQSVWKIEYKTPVCTTSCDCHGYYGNEDASNCDCD